jgi:hypothetical protein
MLNYIIPYVFIHLFTHVHCIYIQIIIKKKVEVVLIDRHFTVKSLLEMSRLKWVYFTSWQVIC